MEPKPKKDRRWTKNTAEDEQLRLATEFAKAGARLGCPIDQMDNFMKAGVWLQPKQLEMSAAARKADSLTGPKHIGVGGARGGSKSHWVLSQIGCDDCQRYPGLKVLLLRKIVKANKEQFNDFRLKLYKHLKHNYREQKGQLEFENGSTIIVGHFKDEKDIDNYLGLEYDVIAIEELTTLTYEKWKNVMSVLRTSKPGWRPRSYASWNWGGIGHAFAKRLFYDKTGGSDERCEFIKATVYDNRFVDPDYRSYLESLTGWKRKSWLEGDPNFQAGQFFTAWSEKDHVLQSLDTRIIRRWMGGLDYGRTHPTVFLLCGEDAEGRLFFVDEYSLAQNTTEENALNIKSLLRRHNLEPPDLDFIAAGRDCFSNKEDGTTIADGYEANGIILSPAEIDRVNGWSRMAELLGDPEKGIKPKMFIHRNCKNLIAQIPLAQHHETRPEDVEKFDADENGDGGDDSLDCARFVVATNPATGVIKYARAITVGKYRMIGG